MVIPKKAKVIIIGGIHIKTINVSESYKYVNKVKRMFKNATTRVCIITSIQNIKNMIVNFLSLFCLFFAFL